MNWKSEKQRETLININKLFNGRNDAINFFYYGLVILEAKRKEAEEEPIPEPTKTKTKHKKSPFN